MKASCARGRSDSTGPVTSTRFGRYATALGWLSLFRTSFFEDRQPIGIYLQDMVNSSLQDMTLFETHTPVEELMPAIEERGLWDFNLDMLREKFPKRQSQS
ncbi:MAG: hypothetical protein CML24_11275 [Rhizobiales bacterium]|nr:hypothetical protein [Hyphomicrobiales bacterium]